MSGDAHVSWPSDRGRLSGLIDRVLGRFVTLLGRARSRALARMRHLAAREVRFARGIRERDLPRMVRSQLVRARSKRPPVSPSARDRVGARGTRSAPFSTVRVGPEFSPGDYGTTFAALQEPAVGGTLLDLVPARLWWADLFDELARAWTVGPETVPRLGILVSFERWVMQREAALAQLQPLVARGVRIGVFYMEQSSAGDLGEWFTRGSIVHNVRGAIATLATRWHPSESWRMVLDELARLARAHEPVHELPALLTEIAALAMSCGGAVEAETLAREALLYLPESSSATRSQVLRELGTALLCQGGTAAGLALLDQAFAMAMQADAPHIGASAMYHSGLCALIHGDYPGAEQRFRRAIELLSPPDRRRHLLAQAHHSLAVALLHQGRPEAEHHARTALALRRDPNSQPAVEDRLLLAKLRARPSDRPASIGSLPERPSDAPEADV